jgi:ribonucleoside-triphosphate reductase
MGQGVWIDSENLSQDDTVEEVLKHGTLSVGFIGLAECLVALTGKHHGEDEESRKLGLEIITHMRNRMDEETKRTGLNFSLLATPAEGLSGRFVSMDKKRFGEIKGVTDREYYTNSFHVPVYYDTTHYHKMAVEGQYHKYCNAGHISYVEFSAPPIHNLEVIEKELNHMADSDVGYAGINFPIDFCDKCNHQGVIDSDDCPVCGAKHSIHHIRRVTGYFSEVQNMNDGKRGEVRDRKAMKFLK